MYSITVHVTGFALLVSGSRSTFFNTVCYTFYAVLSLQLLNFSDIFFYFPLGWPFSSAAMKFSLVAALVVVLAVAHGKTLTALIMYVNYLYIATGQYVFTQPRSM